VAGRWLAEQSSDAELVVVAGTMDAANELLRAVADERGAVFGWQRLTLGRLAGLLAEPVLAAEGWTMLGRFGAVALVARVVHKLEHLGRYEIVAQRPGFPLAVARTLEELRLAGTAPADLADADLARIFAAYEAELSDAGLADRAAVFRCASRALASQEPSVLVPTGAPALLLDLPLTYRAETELIAALAARCPEVLATTPAGDARSAEGLSAALGTRSEDLDAEERPAPSLQRVQRYLFQDAAPPVGQDLDDGVSIFSAPGESRECVEIARRIRQEAERGVRFDRMAVVVHAVHNYRGHLEEALGRAEIPVHTASGVVRPDPSGRAFLALLACAAEGLGAERFAEYLSLGEVPQADAQGAPPPALPPHDRWVPPDQELAAEVIVAAASSEALASREEQEREAEDALDQLAPVRAGTLRAPRRWERLVNAAAVLGGLPRWEGRLAGLARQLQHRLDGLDDPQGPRAAQIERDMGDLGRLQAFALPLLRQLDELPEQGSWGEWIDALGALASRGLRRPERVLAELAKLTPMAPTGPVDLAEVRRVLSRRLAELVEQPQTRRYGKVFVGAADGLRGLSFDVVFVPGLAEKLFPRKILEDPILPDAARGAVDPLLVGNEVRVERERLALRLAVGAAERRIYLSYPRIDLQHARPRVPSFYGLELLRAARGELPGFDELARLAEVTGAARLSWPAPANREDAIDDAEYDLALLESLGPREADAAAYLLGANPHLGRAIRGRSQRWSTAWTVADGLVKPSAAAAAALQEHRLDRRTYSPTALQHYAACPYRFLLSAVLRLAPLERPEPVEQMDPLLRGSLVHDVQYELLTRLRKDGLLPVRGSNLDQAQAALEAVLEAEARRYHDDVAPAIDRVWDDGVAAIRADLREWLRLASEDDSGWIPWRFEYSFGLTRDRSGDQIDDSSTQEPAALACGIRLRGKIDLVERRDETLRATDHKTGRAWVKQGAVIEGGQVLQPLLYALALEALAGAGPVVCGRLFYCTTKGGYAERVVELDERAREAAQVVASTVDRALERGFLPAAPAERACRFCDYQLVCGPSEELRTGRKSRRHLGPLLALRKEP
jgi:ATP-dependent helicase/nuclease subunit B